MATFKIDQNDNQIAIYVQGEAEQADVYERTGRNPDGSLKFEKTGEKKFVDEDKKIAVWNVPAIVSQVGNATQLSKKLIVESATKPEVGELLGQSVTAQGLRVDTNGRFFADSVQAVGNHGAKFGGDAK